MNTTAQFFQTKQQYIDFRKAFAAGQKDKACRKSYTESTGTRWNDKTQSKETYTYRTKHAGWMNSIHYLLFNLVTGKNYYNGFTPKTKESFISGGGIADRGLNTAISELATLIENAQTILGQRQMSIPSYFKDKEKFKNERLNTLQNVVNIFLRPFDGGFTIEDLARVQLPCFPGLTHEQILAKVTYKQAYGEQIADQEPPRDMVETDINLPVQPLQQPVVEKKGFFSRMFS